MQLTVNGESLQYDAPLCITELLEKLELTEGRVAVELNREIVSKTNYEKACLEDGDTLEIVHFIGGG